MPQRPSVLTDIHSLDRISIAANKAGVHAWPVREERTENMKEESEQNRKMELSDPSLARLENVLFYRFSGRSRASRFLLWFMTQMIWHSKSHAFDGKELVVQSLRKRLRVALVFAWNAAKDPDWEALIISGWLEDMKQRTNAA